MAIESLKPAMTVSRISRAMDVPRSSIYYRKTGRSGEVIETGIDRLVFNEIRDQIMAKRIRIKKGNMQDASFIEEDKGEYGKPREEDAKTRRSKDGSSATKNNEKHFGYKAHTFGMRSR